MQSFAISLKKYCTVLEIRFKNNHDSIICLISIYIYIYMYIYMICLSSDFTHSFASFTAKNSFSRAAAIQQQRAPRKKNIISH